MPPHYASIAIVIVLAVLRGWLRHDPLPWPGLAAIAAHMAFLEGALGMPELNIVYWTLAIEVQFYVAFAALLWCCDAMSASVRSGSARAFAFRNGAVVAASFFSLGWPLGVFGPAPHTAFIGYWYAFLAGVLAFRSVRHGGVERVVLGLYSAGLVAAAAVAHGPAPLVVAVTAFGIALVGAQGRLGTTLNWAPLQFVGRVSYSLYLLHVPLTTLVGSVTRRLMPSGAWRDGVGLSATLTLSLAAAAMLWWLVERPGQTRGRGLASGRPAVGAPPAGLIPSRGGAALLPTLAIPPRQLHLE